MAVFFANITGKRLIIRHYQLYQPLPVKLDKSCLYLSWSFYICGGRFILSNFFKYLSWSCYICMVVLYQPFFIFVLVMLYLPWSFYINRFFIFVMVMLYLPWSFYINLFFYICHGHVIFAVVILYLRWSFYFNHFFFICHGCVIYLHGRFILAFYQLYSPFPS